MSSTMRQAGLIQHGALTMTMIGAIPTGLSYQIRLYNYH